MYSVIYFCLAFFLDVLEKLIPETNSFNSTADRTTVSNSVSDKKSNTVTTGSLMSLLPSVSSNYKESASTRGSLNATETIMADLKIINSRITFLKNLDCYL